MSTTALPDAPATGAHAQRWLDEHGLPTGREEAWRYTPIRDIVDRLAGARPAPADADAADLVGAVQRHAPTRLVVVNGVPVPALSDLTALPSGVRLDTSSDPLPGAPRDGFDALNRAEGTHTVRLVLDDGIDLEAPVEVLHVAVPEGDRAVSHPRLVVDAGAGSRLRLLETHTGAPGGAVTNATTSIRLGDGAEVDVQRVQHEAVDAVHLGRLEVHQQAGSGLRALAVGRGAAVARLQVHVTFAGDDAAADLVGLTAPVPGCRHDAVVSVDHAASRCRSRQRFRSVVADRARSSFSGHVVVRPGTVRTDAHQRSDALLLAPTAQADSRPWLEIFADDVRCDHGSATGRLDDDALFYLRSRGIPLDQARRILVAAFARHVTEQLTAASLRHEVEGWFMGEDGQ